METSFTDRMFGHHTERVYQKNEPSLHANCMKEYPSFAEIQENGASQMIGLNSSRKMDAHHLHDLNYGSILFNSCNLDGFLKADSITICMKKIYFHLFQIASLIAGFIRNLGHVWYKRIDLVIK